LVEAGKKLLVQGQTGTAVARFRVALQLQPYNAEGLQQLAWLLATSPDVALRNGTEAVQLAERACTLTNAQDCRLRGVLDAAYGEAGRFADAITAVEQAKRLALAAGDQPNAQAADLRLGLYRQQRPFRQAP
jgi:Flp pilus assembly protein TadD